METTAKCSGFHVKKLDPELFLILLHRRSRGALQQLVVSLQLLDAARDAWSKRGWKSHNSFVVTDVSCCLQQQASKNTPRCKEQQKLCSMWEDASTVFSWTRRAERTRYLNWNRLVVWCCQFVGSYRFKPILCTFRSGVQWKSYEHIFCLYQKLFQLDWWANG